MFKEFLGMLHRIVDHVIILNYGIINVPLNSNICNSHGRELLFSLLQEFVLLRNPMSLIGMCLHVMSFRVCVIFDKCVNCYTPWSRIMQVPAFSHFM